MITDNPEGNEEIESFASQVKVKSVSCSVMSDSAIPWNVIHQGPLSMGFSRQEYRSRLPFPSPGDLPNPGIEPGSPALQADALPSEPPGKPIVGSGVASFIRML